MSSTVNPFSVSTECQLIGDEKDTMSFKNATDKTNHQSDQTNGIGINGSNNEVASSSSSKCSDSSDVDEDIIEIREGTNEAIVISDGEECNDKPQRQKCEICVFSEAKYTCPACGIKTCSCICVKEHKRKFSCSGQRNKAAFVDKSQYRDEHLLNDYRFLEDAQRVVAGHAVGRNRSFFHSSTAPYYVRKRMKFLTTGANKRGMNLQLLPFDFSNRRKNTSFYNIKEDCFVWHLTLQFVDSSLVVEDERVSEKTTLKEEAMKFFDPLKYGQYTKELRTYINTNADDLVFLLKYEGLPANRKRYCKLDGSSSLKENLKGQSLVEFPHIIITTDKSYMDKYPILSTDDLPLLRPDIFEHAKKNQSDLFTGIRRQLLDPKSSVYSGK